MSGFSESNKTVWFSKLGFGLELLCVLLFAAIFISVRQHLNPRCLWLYLVDRLWRRCGCSHGAYPPVLDDPARSESWIGDGLFGVDRRCGDCLGAVECPGRAARVVRSFRHYN